MTKILLQIFLLKMAQMSKKPKIEMVDNLSEMSKKIYQIINLTDYLDRLVETETSLEKAKATIKSFIVDIERVVKNYTSYEMNLVSLLKDDTIDFSKLEISKNTSKDSNPMNSDVPLSQAGASTSVSFRPQTSKIQTIFEKLPISPYREIMKLHGDTMERLFGLTYTKEMIVDKSGIYPQIHFLQGANPKEMRDWYDFGSIATIHMTSPDFPKIERLPEWIKEGVKDNFGNNPMIKINDVIALDFFCASPDFDENQTYPV